MQSRVPLLFLPQERGRRDAGGAGRVVFGRDRADLSLPWENALDRLLGRRAVPAGRPCGDRPGFLQAERARHHAVADERVASRSDRAADRGDPQGVRERRRRREALPRRDWGVARRPPPGPRQLRKDDGDLQPAREAVRPASELRAGDQHRLLRGERGPDGRDHRVRPGTRPRQDAHDLNGPRRLGRRDVSPGGPAQVRARRRSARREHEAGKVSALQVPGRARESRTGHSPAPADPPDGRGEAEGRPLLRRSAERCSDGDRRRESVRDPDRGPRERERLRVQREAGPSLRKGDECDPGHPGGPVQVYPRVQLHHEHPLQSAPVPGPARGVPPAVRRGPG